MVTTSSVLALATMVAKGWPTHFMMLLDVFIIFRGKGGMGGQEYSNHLDKQWVFSGFRPIATMVAKGLIQITVSTSTKQLAWALTISHHQPISYGNTSIFQELIRFITVCI